ncbi:hypothetical protein G3N55_00905 [Dissulfurirhabdus thermomarina]|uniref:6-bladed beta-propeller n=1 Tax=Dissulfurirhabdus thermomarina TaxID=1765737 RepID=A0A6N9TJH8_DISTH|nr:hypothetical protein [Dissulfurirhabdus thermomarina]NDY41411.1 hypothetical protein [Dissulfurirhabdus thermomarina]NMX24399.1 hypothetical protein [Dissulfurirhabdus thermomarina]
MKPTNPARRHRFLAAAALAVLLLPGCAGKRGGPAEAVFFPPAPNPPRIQFLLGVGDSRDVEGRPSGFSLFVMGDEEARRVKPIVKPYGVTAKNGKVYLVDASAARVAVIDFPGRTFRFLKGNAGMGAMKKPINVAVDDKGTAYVTDVARREILVYDPEGNYVKAVGRPLGMKPIDVAVSGSELYVVDFGHSAVRILDRWTGRELGAVGQGEGLGERLSLPTHLDLDARGFIYCTNIGTGRVMKFDRDNHLLQAFGRLGDGFGQFARPKGIAVDHEGRIYVVDAGHQNVQVFDPEGRLLMFFGDPGLPVGSMNLPAGIAVSRDNLDYFQTLADPSFKLETVIYVTNQFGPHKLAVYGLGRKEGVDYEAAPAAGDGNATGP